MATSMINYTLDSHAVANQDGSFPANFSGTRVTNGPGRTTIGKFPRALDFGTSGHAQVDLTDLNPDPEQFCFQFVFQVDGPVTERQNLFEASLLPFAIFILPGKTAEEFEITATVRPAQHAWSGPNSQFKRKLKIAEWYVVHVAYDYDTLGLFVSDTAGNERLTAVHAFPHGELIPGWGTKLFIGTWSDGKRNQFQGRIAAFQWFNGIPEAIEIQLDEQRTQAPWFISHKYESIRSSMATGQRTEDIFYDTITGSHIQYYEHCGILYHPSNGTAFEIHGAIYSHYKRMSDRTSLGYLVSDELPTVKAGGRKSVFNRGAIYFSSATGAVPVIDQIYLDYEHLGATGTLGLPTQPVRKISGGLEQEFQLARMYHRNGASNAQEVHGAILAKFLASGGVNTWGYPITNEMDVRDGSKKRGKFSEFERCTIYWSRQTGAHEVHGDIRRKYEACQGPVGELGFPTSDESDIPGATGSARMNAFQRGSILWYGSYRSIIVARPFKIFIGRIDSQESESWGMGQNDLYFRYIRIKEGSTDLFHQRYPGSGDWSDRNARSVNYTVPVTITPDAVDKRIEFSVSIYDGDPGRDDFLGSYTKTLDAANAWGLRENGGTYNEAFKKIRSFTWSVQPQVDIPTLSEKDQWWAVENQGTDDISWQQCASAYRDIDSDTEWWDITDWLDKAFYELAVKDIAENGNCFGMALEGIYARKNASLFSLPIDRFSEWGQLEPEFNIKHCYQLGASAVWWFLGQVVTGNTHDPKDVFVKTRQEFEKGNHPVICVAQNYTFTGAPHCVLPVAWDSSTKPWKITICDPNFPKKLKTLTVNPDDNSFEYVGSSTYRGSEWSGGRFHYMPFTVLNKEPRTPVWDAILLLLSGTIIILADDAETSSITDGDGQDLDAYGDRARELMQAGRRPDEFFVSFPGFDRSSQSGQILLRSDSSTQNYRKTSGADLPMRDVVRDRQYAQLAAMLSADPAVERLIAGKTAHQIMNDPNIQTTLTSDMVQNISSIANVNASRNYVHTIRGKRNGKLSYVAKHRLNEVRIEGEIRTDEAHRISISDLGTPANTLRLSSDNDKPIKLTINNKLGVNGDYLQIELPDIPVSRRHQLELNIRPGVAGFDLVAADVSTEIPVSIRAKVGGTLIRRSYRVPLEGGVRLKPASVLAGRELTGSKIDRPFGPVKSTFRLKD